MKRLVGLVLGIIWSGQVSEAGGATPPQHEEVRQVMGTMATVRVWADDLSVARAASDSVFAVFAAVDSAMSTWNGNSAVSRLNRAPAGQWVPVGRAVCEVLSAAVAVAQLTEGAFDPTVLPLVRLWGFRGGRPAVPTAEALKIALSRVDFRAIEVASPRARLHRPGMAVDLGGIAKGYALDQAAAAMRVAGATGGVLDLGGNLLVFGTGPGREVGVIDPSDPEALGLTIPVTAGAVATSGQYENTIAVGGKVYGHILDPRSGWPVPAGLSATVIAEDAVWADALGTAVFVLGGTAGLALLEELPGVEGVVVDDHGLKATTGLQPSLAQNPRFLNSK